MLHTPCFESARGCSAGGLAKPCPCEKNVGPGLDACVHHKVSCPTGFRRPRVSRTAASSWKAFLCWEEAYNSELFHKSEGAAVCGEPAPVGAKCPAWNAEAPLAAKRHQATQRRSEQAALERHSRSPVYHAMSLSLASLVTGGMLQPSRFA